MLGRVLLGVGSLVIGFYLGRQYERSGSVRKRLDEARESDQGSKRLPAEQVPAN